MRIISKKKINEFKRKLKSKKLDAALFICSEPIHDSNVEYFTGFSQLRYHSFSCLLIDSKIRLIVSPSSYSRAKSAKVDELINLADYKRSLTAALKDKLKKAKRIGIIGRLLPHRVSSRLKGKRFVDITDIIGEVRGVKESKETMLLKKSCRIADRGVKAIERNLSKKLTEKQLAELIEDELLKRGADELAFPTLIASGKSSVYIHSSPRTKNKKLSRGLGFVDFGARYKGYCSDITVPFLIKPSDKEREIAKIVKAAYRVGLQSVKVNLPTWKACQVVNNFLKEKGFEFKHSLGHGLGLDTHDYPNISLKPESKERLKYWKEVKFKPNMVFTIEPGVYVDGLGGCRFENDVLLTKKGPRVLTHSKLIEI